MHAKMPRLSMTAIERMDAHIGFHTCHPKPEEATDAMDHGSSRGRKKIFSHGSRCGMVITLSMTANRLHTALPAHARNEYDGHDAVRQGR